MPDEDGKRLPFKEEFDQELKKTGETTEAFYNAVENIREAGKAVKAGMEKRVANRLNTLGKIAAIDEKSEEIEEIPIPEQYLEAAIGAGWTFEQIEQFVEDNPERALRVLARLYKNSSPLNGNR